MSASGKEMHHPCYILLNVPSLKKTKADFYAIMIDGGFILLKTEDMLQFLNENFNELGKIFIFYL